MSELGRELFKAQKHARDTIASLRTALAEAQERAAKAEEDKEKAISDIEALFSRTDMGILIRERDAAIAARDEARNLLDAVKPWMELNAIRLGILVGMLPGDKQAILYMDEAIAARDAFLSRYDAQGQAEAGRWLCSCGEGNSGIQDRCFACNRKRPADGAREG